MHGKMLIHPQGKKNVMATELYRYIILTQMMQYNRLSKNRQHQF